MTRGQQAADIREAIARFADADERIAWLLDKYPHVARASMRRMVTRELTRLDSSEQERDIYTHDDEEYSFRLAGEKPFSVPVDQVQEWVRWYVTDGAGVTQRTITRMSWQVHGRPLTKDYARRIFRCLGIDKGSPPFAPHLLAKYSADELAKLHFATAQADVEVRLRADEPREWRANWLRAERKLAEAERKLTEHEAFADALANRINRHAPPRPSSFMLPETETLLLVAIYDAHIGKRTVSGESTTANLMTCCERLFARTLLSKPQRVELVFGGDFVHVDNERGTTSGTPQDMSGDWVDVIHEAWDVAERIIELWRKLGAQMVVRIIPGNHDRGACWHLAAGMHALYRDASDVHVVRSRDEMQATTYGQTLLVYEHGDGPKPRDMAAVIANGYPRLWGDTSWRYVVTGHLHHTHEYDAGVTILQQPSVAGSDRWHAKRGYTTSKHAMRAYSFCQHTGLVTTWTSTL